MKMRGTVDRVDRLPNSANGNPRWAVTLTSGHRLVTLPDAAFASWLDPDAAGGHFTLEIVLGEIVSMEPSDG